MNEILIQNDEPKSCQPADGASPAIKPTALAKPFPLSMQTSIDLADADLWPNWLPYDLANGQSGALWSACGAPDWPELALEPAPSCSAQPAASTPQSARSPSVSLPATPDGSETADAERRPVMEGWKLSGRRERPSRGQVIKKKFAQFEGQSLASAPAPDVKIGQRVAYKEYYGNEFGTIRWIGRVPQISADWTVGVEFDNAIGEGDGSLHGRRYFIAKDCFAKFLPLASVVLVDQHVGRPEPGTMISVMSAAVRPGQMISIQRVSTVHVQHCFLNAPHRRPGAEFLAVNTRLHCQCPNCGPCAHVVKPPRTQRLRTPKNATHMCQFSTYTCCGMESSEEALCTYTGNKISSLPPPGARQNSLALPPLANSWIEGAGYLSTLQAEQRKLMPEEYRIGAAPDDAAGLRRNSSGRRQHQHGAHAHKLRPHKHRRRKHQGEPPPPPPPEYSNLAPLEGAPASALELVMPAPGEPSMALALRPEDKLEGLYEPEEAASGEYVAEPQKRPRAVVYRDSIENRYLFPTDDADADADAIDSTLEQDLEDLSLARYGYLRNPDRKHTRSCASSGNSRNLIVKSLRSLVACLGAGRPRSDIEPSYESSQTLRIVAERPLSGGAAAPINKSRPMLMARDAHSPSWRSASPSTCSSSGSSPTKGRQHDFYEPIGAHQQRQQQPFGGQVRQEAAGALVQAAERPVGGHPVRRQISSSSDCGFSSASQNSNLVASSSPLLRAQPAQLEELERRRLGAIYERLAARLVQSSSSSSPVTAQDLLKIRSSLFELRAQSASFGSGSQLDCCEQLLAELIKKSVLRANAEPARAEQRQQPHSTTTSAERGRSDDDGGGSSTSQLPRAFELKLTLSINENAKRQLEGDAGGPTGSPNSATSAAASESALTHADAGQGQAGVNFSLHTPAVVAEQSTAG